MLPWVLLPGTLCTDACFSTTLSALADEGISPPSFTRVPGNAASAGEEAVELLARMPERVVVCAFSLGGFVAFQAALRSPERIAAMILISVTGRADPVENAVTRRTHVERARRDSTVEVIREVLWPNYVTPASLNDRPLRRAIEAMAAETDLDRFARQSEIAITRPDVRDSLTSVRTPTLVISGEDDAATPPERGAEIAAALPEGHHVLVADAGHFVMMEKPRESAREIARWLDSIRDATGQHSRSGDGEHRP